MIEKGHESPISDLLGFEDEHEKFEFQKEVLSLKFVKVMEQFLDQTDLSRKELASQMQCSQSYISQVFNATKFVNMDFLVKFQNAIGLPFSVKLGDYNDNQMDIIYNKRYDELANKKDYRSFYPSATIKSNDKEELLEG
ncbi:helix-turn-helix transcriptional regulator [Maribacter confluentis]|uniref:Helix-turn-helix transcriptional regulator n=1 Tax=Maribacter confluentis TaxID=1656093 RepID=A0ABT8RT41_9FLAO|nr:helix-turn-helix transcriptional regulator [Maribacter confluentis]MDO1513524.1 helix-turn-helix transcriptional regulator [Maribacter confluentis]